MIYKKTLSTLKKASKRRPFKKSKSLWQISSFFALLLLILLLCSCNSAPLLESPPEFSEESSFSSPCTPCPPTEPKISSPCVLEESFCSSAKEQDPVQKMLSLLFSTDPGLTAAKPLSFDLYNSYYPSKYLSHFSIYPYPAEKDSRYVLSFYMDAPLYQQAEDGAQEPLGWQVFYTTDPADFQSYRLVQSAPCFITLIEGKTLYSLPLYDDGMELSAIPDGQWSISYHMVFLVTDEQGDPVLFFEEIIPFRRADEQFFLDAKEQGLLKR